MDVKKFRATLAAEAPPEGSPATLVALWWDAKGDWTQAHIMVDELETPEGMAVHAYLHRKEGSEANANYWYERAGSTFRRSTLEAEWEALVSGLVSSK
jgi:hypothetical protein